MYGTLAPKNLERLLGETFTIYKDNFLRFIAIAAIVYVPSIILYCIAKALTSSSLDTWTTDTIPLLVVFVIILILAALALIVASVWMTGATIHAMAQQYFSRPISIGQAYNFAWRRLGAMFGAGIIAYLALVGIYLAVVLIMVIFTAIVPSRGMGWLLALALIPLFVVDIIVIIYLGINWNFIFQTTSFERCGPTTALSRSSALVKGSWWRILGIILLLVFIVQSIVMIPAMPGMIGYVRGIMSEIATEYSGGFMPYSAPESSTWEIWLTIGSAIGNIIALPILLIGQTLLYFDLRVRKEGYSLDTLANELGLRSPTSDTTATSPPV